MQSTNHKPRFLKEERKQEIMVWAISLASWRHENFTKASSCRNSVGTIKSVNCVNRFIGKSSVIYF